MNKNKLKLTLPPGSVTPIDTPSTSSPVASTTTTTITNDD